MKPTHVVWSLAVLGLLSACTTRVVMDRSQAAPLETASHAAGGNALNLGVPPGHLPPPGLCRVWVSGTPPGRQARARSCDGIEATAPAGSMILYRPTDDRDHVEARYVDGERPGVVVWVDLFEAKTGRVVNPS